MRPSVPRSLPLASASRRRLLRRVAALAGVALISTIGLTACSSGSGAGTKSDSITVAVPTPPLSLDPAKSGNTPAGQLYMDLAYEPLINLAGSGKLTPGLATAWKYTDSRLTTFQLTLRDNAKFSDGKPLTAESVVNSINYQKTAGGPVAIYANAIASAKALDTHTVQLNLVRSDPTIATLLTQRFFIGSIVGPGGLANKAALGTTTNGAGEYMIDPAQTVANDHYTYVPNPYYYDKSAIHFKTFTVKVIANPQTALNALKSGQIAYTNGNFASAAQAKGAGLNVLSTLSSWYSINLWDRNGKLVPALAKQDVRQALNYALDRDSITKAIFASYGQPTSEISIAGYEKDGYDPAYQNHYTYDIAKAKQLMAAAGYPNGFSLTIGAAADYGDGVQLAQAVADAWSKIGVKVKIQSYSTVNDMVAPWSGGKLPAIAGFYDTQPMYIETQQALAADAGLFNPFKTEDPTLTGLINAAYAETDQAKVPAAWAAAQRRVVDLGWFVPIAVGASLYYSSKDLKGTELSPTAFVPDPTQFHY